MNMDLIKHKNEIIQCKRCGVCCSMGSCSHGVEDDRGICEFLVISLSANGYYTSCRLLLENKVKKSDILGTGCVLRKLPYIFEYYSLQMKRKLEC